jgi:N utilization substance protein B
VETKDSKRGSGPSKWRNFRASCAQLVQSRLWPESRGASKVSLRTKAREFAMQMLFQWDMSQQDFSKLENKFWKSAKAADSTRAFANRLFEGAAKDAAALDEIIVKHAENWRFERLAAIDRAILRLAVYELRGSETPPKVVLNEAVELAKKFSSEESGSFVNGILDAVHKSL